MNGRAQRASAAYQTLQDTRHVRPIVHPRGKLKLSCIHRVTNQSSQGSILHATKKLTFIMLGRVAYRGSFRRKSAVTTAGSDIDKTSVPVSVSRSTSSFLPPSSTTTCTQNHACGNSPEHLCMRGRGRSREFSLLELENSSVKTLRHG